MSPKKKQQEQKISDFEKFQIKAGYYLEMLEKRITEEQQKLNKLEELIRKAAERKDKLVLMEALRLRKTIERNLRTHLGLYRKIRVILENVQKAQELMGVSEILKEGQTLLEATTSVLQPESIELTTAAIEESIEKIHEAESILAEDIEIEEEEDIEEEAEKLIAEFSLPKIKSKTKKVSEEEKEEDLLSELKRITES